MTSCFSDLRKDETWFWNTEPRIVLTLIQEAKKIKKQEMKMQAIYNASIFSGNDIDKEESEEGIAGIDRPAGRTLF